MGAYDRAHGMTYTGLIVTTALYLFRQAGEAAKHVKRTEELLADFVAHVKPEDIARWKAAYPGEGATLGKKGEIISRYRMDDSKRESTSVRGDDSELNHTQVRIRKT